MRALAACVVLGLGFSPALAADPKIDAAVKVFKSVGGDAGKLKTFCTMLKAEDAAADPPTPAQLTQIDGYKKQLGPDFAAAYDLGANLDDNTPDGKAWGEAIDELAGKCPE
jgi:hypothetical protein